MTYPDSKSYFKNEVYEALIVKNMHTILAKIKNICETRDLKVRIS